MGHPSAEAVERLENAATGVKITAGADTAICEPCRLSKAREIVSRRSDKEDPAEAPLARVAYDLINFHEGYNGDNWVSHFTCCFTSMDFVYTYSSKNDALSVITEFVNMARNRYGYRTRYFRTDGERTLSGKFNNLIASLGITTERSAPATPAQNGAAERSRGVIVVKARCLRITANLPANL
jgi:transposase InsO family protein